VHLLDPNIKLNTTAWRAASKAVSVDAWVAFLHTYAKHFIEIS
jgi:hypothetical protein